MNNVKRGINLYLKVFEKLGYNFKNATPYRYGGNTYYLISDDGSFASFIWSLDTIIGCISICNIPLVEYYTQKEFDEKYYDLIRECKIELCLI